MVVKLYKTDISPPCRAAMVACEVFNVPVEFVEVNLSAGEHLTPEYLKINPCHTVPTLVDGDLVLHDSHAILMYLADTYGDNSAMYPKDIRQRVLVNQKLFFNNSVLLRYLGNVVYPAFMEGVKGVSEKKRSDIEEAYKLMETFLSDSKYISGSDITIADVACYTITTGLNHIVPVTVNRYPKLMAWIKDIEGKPYCQKADAPGNKAYRELLHQLIGL